MIDVCVDKNKEKYHSLDINFGVETPQSSNNFQYEIVELAEMCRVCVSEWVSSVRSIVHNKNIIIISVENNFEFYACDHLHMNTEPPLIPVNNTTRDRRTKRHKWPPISDLEWFT